MPLRGRFASPDTAAAVYFDVVYVDAGFWPATAKAIDGLRSWVTNQYEHDGLRVGNRAVLGRLIDMVRGVADPAGACACGPRCQLGVAARRRL
jgi:hypothetical protein